MRRPSPQRSAPRLHSAFARPHRDCRDLNETDIASADLIGEPDVVAIGSADPDAFDPDMLIRHLHYAGLAVVVWE